MKETAWKEGSECDGKKKAQQERNAGVNVVSAVRCEAAAEVWRLCPAMKQLLCDSGQATCDRDVELR